MDLGHVCHFQAVRCPKEKVLGKVMGEGTKEAMGE